MISMTCLIGGPGEVAVLTVATDAAAPAASNDTNDTQPAAISL
jgi:hypothetical protein